MTAPEPTAAPVKAGTNEPLVVAESVRGLLVAVVAAGWVVVPDTTVNIIVSVVGVVGSIVSTILARRHVVPLAKLVNGIADRPA